MNTVELIITFLSKVMVTLVGATGLLMSTKEVVIDINPPFIVAVVICAVIFAYGFYSLIKDFPKLYKNLTGK